jgi:hypothetical protein
MTSAKVVRQCTAACTVALAAVLPFSAIAATCGHDAHGAPRMEETKLAPNNSIITYFSPATIIMENPSDPRHRAFGECRGQGVVTDGVPVWLGGCTYKNPEGDVFWVTWSSKPGDTGSENRDAPKGTAVLHGTGKFQGLNGKTAKWTGLANGGSYVCDDPN